MSDNQILGASYYVKHAAIIAVFCGLASVAVIFRLWARRIQKMSLELNDYLIVFGLVSATLPSTSKFVLLSLLAMCLRRECRRYIWYAPPISSNKVLRQIV